MRLFRRVRDLNRASVRVSTSDDLHRVSRLIRDGARRYYAFTGSDLPLLLDAGNAVVLEAAGEVWGVALLGWPATHTNWLRGFALSEGVELLPALELLLPLLHTIARAQGIEHIFYAGDESADSWMLPALQATGYIQETTVVVYEKRDLLIPHWGNQEVYVRPAYAIDLAAVVALDQACFEAQWTKDDTILGPAISHGALFVVAELNDQIVGYAYATRHFGGRLVHLVRIAVHPRYQGLAIGVRLLAEVVEFAQHSNANVITLNTQSYNVQAQRLYQWFGFVLTGECQVVLRYDLQEQPCQPE